MRAKRLSVKRNSNPMALREILAKFGFEFDENKAKKADQAVEGLSGKLKGLAGIFAAGYVVNGLKNLAAAALQEADATGKAAQQLGLTIEQYQTFAQAATEAGSSAAGLSAAFKSVSNAAVMAANGGKEAKAMYDDLGVSIKDADGNLRSNADILVETGAALAALEDPTKKSAYGFKLLGNDSRALMSAFAGGAEDIERIRKELAELGGGFSDDAAASAAEANDAVDRFRFSLKSLKSAVIVFAAPALTAIGTALSKTIGWLANLGKNSEIMKALFVTLGAAGFLALSRWIGPLGKALGLMLKFAKPLLLIMAIALVVEDLIVLFEGGESAIGGFIDKIFGKGTTQDIVKNIKDIYKEAKRLFDLLIEDPVEFENEMKMALAGIREDIKKNFGDGWLFVANSYIAFIDMMTGGWDNFVKGLKGSWEGWSMLFAAVAGYMGQVFGAATDGIANAFTSMWNGIISGAQSAVGKIKDLIGSIPGASKVLDFATSKLEGLKGTLREAQPVSFAAAQERVRNDRAGATIAGPAGATNNSNSVSQRNTVTVNVTAQGGTAETTRAVERGVRQGLSHERSATLAALGG